MNYTYILKCSDQSYYCGWTNDLKRRTAAHNAGTGSRYTRTRLPAAPVYYELWDTKQEAMRREWQIKQLGRGQKERLIAGAGPDTDGIPYRDLRQESSARESDAGENSTGAGTEAPNLENKKEEED